MFHFPGTAVEGGPSEPPNSSQEPEVDDTVPHTSGISFTDDVQLETCEKDTSEDVVMSDSEISENIVSVKSILMERTDGYGVPQLERLYTRVMKGVFETKASEPGYDLRPAIFSYLLKFAENVTNF